LEQINAFQLYGGMCPCRTGALLSVGLVCRLHVILGNSAQAKKEEPLEKIQKQSSVITTLTNPAQWVVQRSSFRDKSVAFKTKCEIFVSILYKIIQDIVDFHNFFDIDSKSLEIIFGYYLHT